MHVDAFYGYGSSTSNINFRDDSNLGNTVINNARNSWNGINNADTSINVTGTSSSFTIDAGTYPLWPTDRWGLNTMTYNSSGQMTSSKIEISHGKINSEYSNANDRINAQQSILAHEFGHLFWLEDNPPSGSIQSIMRGDRERNVLINAHPYDHRNVRFVYD